MWPLSAHLRPVAIRLRAALREMVEVGEDGIRTMDDGLAVDEGWNPSDTGLSFETLAVGAVDRYRACDPVELELRKPKPRAV